MPGGISGLVNKVQGIEKPTVTPPAEPEPEEEITPEPEPISEPVHHEPTLHTKPAAPADEKDRSAPAAKKLPKAEGKELAREYTLQQGDTTDSWQMFLDLAKEYKLRDSKLATVYIDSDLKSVLDRLKSANSIKNAINSAAQFHSSSFRVRPRKEHKRSHLRRQFVVVE